MKKKINLFIGFLLVLLLVGCNNNSGEATATKIIKDDITKLEVDYVDVGDNSFTIDYGYDNMDRGNHDFETVEGHYKIVVEKTKEFQRGNIIYIKYPDNVKLNENKPENYLVRVVGLPGEAVEIVDGQVFIDNKKLEAFYARTTRLGWDLEKYLKNGFSEQTTLTEEDFKEDMEPIKISESAVFVLSDDWFRGSDSRHFGALDVELIEGKVLGYTE